MWIEESVNVNSLKAWLNVYILKVNGSLDHFVCRITCMCLTVLFLLFFNHTESSSAGSAHDIQIFEQLHIINQEPQRLPLLCLSPTQVHDKNVDIAKKRKTQGYNVKIIVVLQVRWQSHFDCVPACVIRYRPSKQAVKSLR